MTRRTWAAAVLLLGVSFLLHAEDNRTSGLFVSPLSGKADPLVEDILGTELGAAVTGAGITVAPQRLKLPEGADQPRPPAEERVSYLLRAIPAASIDVIAAAFYLEEGDELTIQFTLYDPAVKTILGGVLTRARKGLTLFASVGDAVSQFKPVIQRYVQGGYKVEAPTGIVERVQVAGPPEGSRVVFADRDVGVVEGGRLTVPYTQFAIGTKLPVRVVKDGYHSFEGTFPLESPQVTLNLPPMQKETRFDAGLRWSFGNAVGFGIEGRIHLVPDQLFLGMEEYLSLQPGSWAGTAVRHYDTNIHFGTYIIFPYSSFFRISVSAGLGAIATNVEGVAGQEYMDYYLLVGDPTVEFTVGPVKLFARPDLHYALGMGYNLLGRAWIRTPYGLPPLTVGARYSW